MPLETSLNVSPYFDDYDQAKEFYRILFKPGVSVQARELNQLQTILQNQIERFGNHVFKSGTIVSGVNFSYLPNYNYVKILDLQVDGQPVVPSAYVGYYAKASDNLQARIINYQDGLESKTPDLNTLYLQYLNSGTGGNVVFTTDTQLTIYSKDYPLFKVSVESGGLGFSNSDTIVVMSGLVITGATGSFTVGETITDGVSANAVVIESNTTAIADTTILKVKPLAVDLANTSKTSAAWTFADGTNITGLTSSTTATVSSKVGSGAVCLPQTDALGILQYITVSSGGSGYQYLPHVTVQTANTTAPINSLDLRPTNYKAVVTIGNSAISSIGTGYAFAVSEGIIYQKGTFLKVDSDVIIVSKYGTAPDDVAVGFKTTESFVDSYEDSSLFDNAANTTNYSAPGADRLKLVPTLVKKTVAEAAANVDFFALAEWKEGFPYKENRTTVYKNLANELARRTRESQGNFVSDPFLVSTKEKATANVSYVSAVIDPGLAYIDGYRVQTNYNNYIDIKRSTTTTSLSDQFITANYGNYVYIKELAGPFNFKAGASVSLRDTAKGYVTAMTVTSDGSITPAGSEIGTARMRSLVLDSGTPGTPSCTYRLYLFDIQMNAGKSFRQVRSFYYNDTYDGVADAVLVYDATTASNIAVINDVKKDRLLFPVGRSGVAVLSNVNYTYRTISTPSDTAASYTGVITIGPISGVHPYGVSSTLSSTEKQDIFVMPVSNATCTSNTTGSTTLSTGSSTITGTSTSWTTEYQPGDWVKVANATHNTVVQVKTIASATSMTLTANPSAAVTSGNLTPFFPALYPIDLTRSTRTVSINGSGNTMTIDLGLPSNLGAAVNTYVTYNVKLVDASPVSKVVRRERFVKINTATNEASNTGPWHLGIPGIIRLKNVWLGNSTAATTSDTDITKYFSVEANDDENAYRCGKLILNPGADPGVNTGTYLLIKVDALDNNGTEGFFTFGSYTVNATANLTVLNSNPSSGINLLELPETITTKGDYYDLRDSIDFRPYAVNTAALSTTDGSATVNPSGTFALSGDTQYFPVPDSEVSFNVSYYNSRIDRVVVKSDSSFEVVEGIAHPTNPVAPREPKGTVTLEVLGIPQYPSLPVTLNPTSLEFASKKLSSTRGSFEQRLTKFNIRPITLKQNLRAQPRKYTMADIGSIDRRLKAVEYYSSLNQIENSIKELTIPSGITTTTNRFKFGWFVDPFNDYSRSDVSSPEFRATIEQSKSIIKPATKQLNFESKFDLLHANTAAGVVGNTLMLPYSSVVLIDQSIKSSVVGSDGYQTQFVGDGSIEPSSFSLLARKEIIVTPDPVSAPAGSGDYGGVGYGGDSGGMTGDTGSTASSDSSSASTSDGSSGSSGSSSGCFLTTATVKYMGLADDCEELQLARFLRDSQMNSEKDQKAKSLYKIVGPLIVERKTKWDKFYSDTVQPIASLIKLGQYEQAAKLYKLATLKLIYSHSSRYTDVHVINRIFDDLVSSNNDKVPYVAKYAAVKAYLLYKIAKGAVKYNDLQNKLQKDIS